MLLIGNEIINPKFVEQYKNVASYLFLRTYVMCGRIFWMQNVCLVHGYYRKSCC